MKNLNTVSACLFSLTFGWSSVTQAQSKPIIYPAKNQSMEQQQKDDGACYVWAKNNTGIDPAAPTAPPPSATATTSPMTGERAKGALGGAAAGAAIGEVASGDASKGAAVGATVGVLAGAAKARHNKQAQQAAAEQAAETQKNNALATYYRAFSACMEGRGYTLK